MVQSRWRISVGPPTIQAQHIRAGSATNRSLPARGEIAQQHVGVDCAEIDLLARQPPAERQQREAVDADRLRRAVPIRQVAQVLVDQQEPVDLSARQGPTIR